MKHFLILSILLCCYCMAGYSQIAILPPKRELQLTPTKPGPVEAYQADAYVKVAFTTNEGNVNVTMKNSAGVTVYSNTSATNGSSLTIDTTGWARTSYTLRITNRIGFLVAEFNVNYQ